MSSTSSLPDGWQLLSTPSGQPLYYCAATRRTTWQPPQSACAASSCSSQPSSLRDASSPATPAPPQRFPIGNRQVLTRANNNCHSSSTQHSRQRRASDDSRYTFPTLVHNTRSRARGYPLFELEREKVLQINLGSTQDAFVWIRCGSMIARRGNISFSRQRFRDEGLSSVVKRALTGEGIRMTKCVGRGTIYCASNGRAVCLVQLRQQSVFVNGDKIMAMSQSVQHDVQLVKGAGMAASGLFAIKVSGSGFVAFMCEKSAITLQASEEDPVYTDADCTVAWTHAPSLKLDLSLRLCVGRKSGHEAQLKFCAGVVIVQPYRSETTIVSERVASVGAHVATGVLHALT